MDRTTEIRLIKQVLELKARGETQYHAQPHSQNVERYVSAQWFAREQAQIFRGQPLAIGAANEVPNPGDYLALDWLDGVSLLMVRGEDRHVRVFANACRHRNARLVANGESGCSRKFVCPYHAWTYTAEGSLAGAPDFERGFRGMDKGTLGLIEFPSRVIGGIVFVHMDRQQQVRENLLAEEMRSGMQYLDIDHQQVYKRRSYVINANWKILLEGGIEAYHFNVAHKNTLAPFFLGNLSTWESWGGFYLRMILPKKPMLEAPNLPEAQWDMRKMANIIYILSPTVLLLAQPDNISLVRMLPLAPDKTRIEEVLLVERPANSNGEWSAEELKKHETNHNLVHKILMEDWVLGETIQANMQSGMVNEVHFGRFESALTWLHGEYERAMDLQPSAISQILHT